MIAGTIDKMNRIHVIAPAKHDLTKPSTQYNEDKNVSPTPNNDPVESAVTGSDH